MVSIRNLMNQKRDGVARFVQLLLQGIARHVVETEPEETAAFRSAVDELSDSLSENTSHEEILVKIGTAIHALDDYNRRVNRYNKARDTEFRNMISMMTGTISFLTASNRTGVDQLRAIEKGLENAFKVDDVRSLREGLAECLTRVRNESMRLRKDSEQWIDSLKNTVHRASAAAGTVASGLLDHATGLAARTAAQQSLATLILEGKRTAATLFLLDQLVAVNARYGRNVGDDLLMASAQHLATELVEYGTLFRWSGPAFLLITEEERVPLHTLERRVKNLASTRVEKNVKVDHRSILLNITFSWTLQEVTSGDSVDEVCRKLDTFVASYAGVLR